MFEGKCAWYDGGATTKEDGMFEPVKFLMRAPSARHSVKPKVVVWLTPHTDEVFAGADGTGLCRYKAWLKNEVGSLPPQAHEDVSEQLPFEIEGSAVTWRHVSRGGWWLLDQGEAYGQDVVMFAQHVVRRLFGVMADIAIEALQSQDDPDFYWLSRIKRLERQITAWEGVQGWGATRTDVVKAVRRFWKWLGTQLNDDARQRLEKSLADYKGYVNLKC